MKIHAFALGPLATNCYIAHTESEAVVIDPGYDPAPVLAYMNRNRLTLACILNTHLHFDHISGNAALASATGGRVFANPADAYLLRPEMDGTRYGLEPTPPFSYEPLEPGTVTLLGETWQYLSTPGHTPGGLSFYCPAAGAVFVGDVLFCRSVGRTDLAGGDPEALRVSVQEVLFALPPETVVHPGHGPHTTIGEERRLNSFFRVDDV